MELFSIRIRRTFQLVSTNLMEVTGVKTGATHITVKVSNGSEQTITVTVRKNANDNGWM